MGTDAGDIGRQERCLSLALVAAMSLCDALHAAEILYEGDVDVPCDWEVAERDGSDDESYLQNRGAYDKMTVWNNSRLLNMRPFFKRTQKTCF